MEAALVHEVITNDSVKLGALVLLFQPDVPQRGDGLGFPFDFFHFFHGFFIL